MSQVVTINGVTSTSGCPKLHIQRVDRDFLGARRDQLVLVPARDSSYVFPEEPGDRSLVIVGRLRADGISAKRTAVHLLSKWADTAGLVHIIVDDETDRYWEGILTGGITVDDTERYGYVEIEYTVGAYALAVNTSSAALVMNTNPDSDTFSAPDLVSSKPVIELTPHGGNMTSFVLTVNDDALAVTETVASGSTITVSSIVPIVTIGVSTDVNLTGAYNPAAVRMVNVIGTFGQIQPGTNTIELSWVGSATSVDVDITWRERFR